MFLVHVLCSKIKLLSLIFEKVVDHIFECEKISILAYVDMVQRVSTSDSVSISVLFCGRKCHEALCDGTSTDCTLTFIVRNMRLPSATVNLSSLLISIAKHSSKFFYPHYRLEPCFTCVFVQPIIC